MPTGRERFVLDLERDARAQVTLYLREGEAPPRLRYGQLIEVDASVRRPHNYHNPGAFDYARYLARQDIYWTASATRRCLRPAVAGLVRLFVSTRRHGAAGGRPGAPGAALPRPAV